MPKRLLTKNITYAYENRLIYKYKSSNKTTKEESINEGDREKNIQKTDSQERSGQEQGESKTDESEGKKQIAQTILRIPLKQN